MKKNSSLLKFDGWMIDTCHKIGPELMRAALFVVYFWFGLLKVLQVSPAEGLVDSLLVQTLPFIPEASFVIGLGVFEIIVALLFLSPKLTRLAILFLVLHMFTTFLPLVLLPAMVWQSFGVPTLVGQYILKNVIILALALSVGLDLKPLQRSK